MTRVLRPAHLCTLALLLVVPAARAASFDCAKTTRPQEKLVCADARLSALDEAISAAYRDARTKLSPAAREAVQSGQKAWNAWWPRAQSSDPRAVKLGRGETYAVTRAFEDRLKALQVTTGFDGKFTTYDVALYAVLAPDPELESRSPAAHEWLYPQLDLGGLAGADRELASKVNAWLTPPPGDVDLAMKDRGATTETRTRLVVATPNILGAWTSSYLHGLGAPHPNDASRAGYFNKARRRPLVAEDLFAGKQWISVVANGAFAQLRALLDDGLSIEDAGALAGMIQDPRWWGFAPGGLELHFSDDDVAPHAAGPQTVTIPWASLQPYLTEFGRAEVASLK
jgi:uncharacterized protein